MRSIITAIAVAAIAATGCSQAPAVAAAEEICEKLAPLRGLAPDASPDGVTRQELAVDVDRMLREAYVDGVDARELVTEVDARCGAEMRDIASYRATND